MEPLMNPPSTPHRRLPRRAWLALGSVLALFLRDHHRRRLGGRSDKRRQPGEAVSAGHEGHTDVYTCPMHPEVRSHKPGNCPICGMTLVKVATATLGVRPRWPGARARRRRSRGAGRRADGRGDLRQRRDDGPRRRQRRPGRDARPPRHDEGRRLGREAARQRRRPDRAGPATRCSSCTRPSCWPARRNTCARGRPPTSSPVVAAGSATRRPRTWPRRRAADSSCSTCRRSSSSSSTAPGKPQRTIVFRAPFSGYVSEKIRASRGTRSSRGCRSADADRPVARLGRRRRSTRPRRRPRASGGRPP